MGGARAFRHDGGTFLSLQPRHEGCQRGHAMLGDLPVSTVVRFILYSAVLWSALAGDRIHALEPDTLLWTAPPGCPTRDELRRQLARAKQDARQLAIHGVVRADAQGFALELDVSGGAQHFARSLRAADCQSLAESAVWLFELAAVQFAAPEPEPALPAARSTSDNQLTLAESSQRTAAAVSSNPVLYNAHFDFVFRCLRRLGVAAANAEDACQEVFIVLHRRIADIRPDASPRAFLFGIATRVASEQRRKQHRTATLALADDMPASDSSNDPFVATARAQAARQLERFLATLDSDQRAVFMLVELEDFAVPEVCEALGAKLNTVYSRLRLARARFEKYLQAGGFDA